VELSTAAVAPSGYAIDMSEMAVAWGAKRGDGSVRLQFPRVGLDGDHGPAETNKVGSRWRAVIFVGRVFFLVSLGSPHVPRGEYARGAERNRSDRHWGETEPLTTRTASPCGCLT